MADPGEGGRVIQGTPFSAAFLVHCVEAAVAHCVVNTARATKRVVFQLRGASQRNAKWTCGRAVQSMPSLQTALLCARVFAL